MPAGSVHDKLNLVGFPTIVELTTGFENEGLGGPELVLEEVMVVVEVVVAEVEVEEEDVTVNVVVPAADLKCTYKTLLKES